MRVGTWRFYQGVKNEWRWYHMAAEGPVIAASDRGFEKLDACMANAEAAGFGRSGSFQVYLRTVLLHGDNGAHPELRLDSQANAGATATVEAIVAPLNQG